MASLVQQLESVDRHLADVLDAADGARSESDEDLVAATAVLGRLQRRLDGAIASVADRIAERDRPVERAARLSSRNGCRDAVELLRRALRVDGGTARRYAAAATAVHREVDVRSGVPLPSAFPELSAALADGELSVSGMLACTVPLQKARIGSADRAAADALLARFARGLSLDGAETPVPAPAPTTEELAGLTTHILARLDPDGAEPEDRAGERRRQLTIGSLRGGTVPVRGELLPEVAAQLQRLVDSLVNPKADDDGAGGGAGAVRFRLSGDSGDGAGVGTTGRGEVPAHRTDAPPAESADLRSHAQKRHDAFATVVMVAAASGGMPELGGAAPTLVVSVRADDYANRAGRATIEGTGWDVPLGAADHAACAGLVQRVLFDDRGAIAAIGTSGRIFNAHQRRAIVLRDRKCLIPGCEIRAEWCEIHHVEEHARGGPTHTGNGVALCWHHHRTLDTGAWRIRMRDGVPEVRGPSWWDPYGLWRAPRLDHRADVDALDVEREREHVWSVW